MKRADWVWLAVLVVLVVVCVVFGTNANSECEAKGGTRIKSGFGYECVKLERIS